MKRWLFVIVVLVIPFACGLWDLMTFRTDANELSSGHPSISAIDRPAPSRTVVYALGLLINFCTVVAAIVVWHAFGLSKPKLPPCDYCGMPGHRIESKHDE